MMFDLGTKTTDPTHLTAVADIAAMVDRIGAPPDAPLPMPAQRLERGSVTNPAQGWGLWFRRRAAILTRPGH